MSHRSKLDHLIKNHIKINLFVSFKLKLRWWNDLFFFLLYHSNVEIISTSNHSIVEIISSNSICYLTLKFKTHQRLLLQPQQPYGERKQVRRNTFICLPFSEINGHQWNGLFFRHRYWHVKYNKSTKTRRKRNTSYKTNYLENFRSCPIFVGVLFHLCPIFRWCPKN